MANLLLARDSVSVTLADNLMIRQGFPAAGKVVIANATAGKATLSRDFSRTLFFCVSRFSVGHISARKAASATRLNAGAGSALGWGGLTQGLP